HPPTPATYTLSLHDALPICHRDQSRARRHRDWCAHMDWREQIRGRLVDVRRDSRRYTALRIARRAVEPLDGTVWRRWRDAGRQRSEEHTSELQSLRHLVCRL